MTKEQLFQDTNIEATEARIQYTLASLPAIGNWLLEMATVGKDVYLCHREDRHSDGSISHYHYIELSGKQFLAIGGMELEPKKDSV